MSNQQAAILPTADGAEIAQTELKNVVIELSTVALCDEIEHHFSTGTIRREAARDVDFAIDALLRESEAASRHMVCEAVAKPDTVFLMMHPKTF